MNLPPQLPVQLHVQTDAFRVSREPVLLVCEISAALAACVYDDTQAVGGVLHLRYVAADVDGPIDLTDNTLSSDLLLMDRFCKELRLLGARKQSWRVTIFAHTPELPNMQDPAATVIDLVKAYFGDSRLPVTCKEFTRAPGIVVNLDAREGRTWVNQRAPAAAAAPVAAL
jgi:chemotaxis receptor (MCP) glutamine deamidase CheD